MPTLYERIPHGKTYRYREYVTPDPTVPKPQQFYTDEEIITLGVSIGAILLVQLEQLIPEHKRNHRKVKAVTDAILDLARGQGQPIDKEQIDYWCRCWNVTTQQFQAGLLN